jgi:CHAT domain-containing protein
VADLAVQLGNDKLAFEALEFRRGIAIAETEPRRTGSARADPAAGVHYFAVSVFAEHGMFAALRTADGSHRVLRIDMERDRLNALVMRIDPTTWRQSPFRPAFSPRPELSVLMQLLEGALATGAIRQGDHVCVSLDHPLHTMPVHYLELGGTLAVEQLSFSRVASYEDMRRIAAAEPSPVNAIAAVFISPSDATDRENDRKSFQTSIMPIQPRVRAVVEGGAADQNAVLDVLQWNDLVHLHAHGYFPEVPPDTTVDTIREAGILVASEGRLPSRSHPERSLLSPRDLLDASDVAAKYVSLAACVSGLGRPGRGGDMLGLEFAFRLRGTEAVIASHWHIEAQLAAEFYSAYYQFWLIDGVSKATAWREATLKMISTGHSGSVVDTCGKCAFSLFGDWR